jgi:hypothetical protein
MFRSLKRLGWAWTSWRLTRAVRAGRVLRGHQGPSASAPGSIATEVRLVPEITMRVYRAETDTWEDGPPVEAADTST